jgi:hypothetical protein
MGLGGADVTMLENFGAFEDGGWLRQCHRLTGKSGLETRVDRAIGDREDCAGRT